MYKVFSALRESPVYLRCFFLVVPLVWASLSWAFLSDILEAKKQVEGAVVALESLLDAIEEVENLTGIEGEYLAYEKELKEFQKTLNEYEELGLDVRDFVELRNYDPSTLRGQIGFFKNYLRRAKNILKSASSLVKKP